MRCGKMCEKVSSVAAMMYARVEIYLRELRMIWNAGILESLELLGEMFVYWDLSRGSRTPWNQGSLCHVCRLGTRPPTSSSPLWVCVLNSKMGQ